MDMLTAIFAANKAKADLESSGGIGYIEQKELTFDGDLTGKTVVNGYVRLSNKPIDLNEVTCVVADLSLSIAANFGTNRMKFTPDTWTVETLNTDGQKIVNPQFGDCILSVKTATETFSSGLWAVVMNPSDTTCDGWVSKIEYGAIHKIDGKFLPDGGVGYTEVKEVEILSPTVCPLVPDYNVSDSGRYDIPNSEGLDGDHEYYLYVDGQEFIYDYDPKRGSGWSRTDRTDTRFSSFYEWIFPVSIDPIPETVTASIKQVTKIIHPSEEKYLPAGFPGLAEKVNLLESGGVLIEKAKYAFDNGSAYFARKGAYAALYPGSSVTVHFDGTDYEYEVKRCEYWLSIYHAFGNLGLLFPGMCEDNGEPLAGVVLKYDNEIEGIDLMTNDTAATHTVGLTAATVTSRPIDPKRLPDGGVGYTDSKVLSFGGDLTGSTVIENFVLLSDDPIDLYEVSRVSADLSPEGAAQMGFEHMEFGPESWTVENFDDVGLVLVSPEFGPCVVSVSTAGHPILPVGTWGLIAKSSTDAANAMVWVSRIEYGKVLHPIDPKYLPTKVIDLDQFGIGEVILGLAAQGGGEERIEYTDAFWATLGDDTNVDVKMYLNSGGTILEFGGVSKAYSYDGSRWLQLSSSLLTLDNRSGAYIAIYVAIVRLDLHSEVVVRLLT